MRRWRSGASLRDRTTVAALAFEARTMASCSSALPNIAE
jgi:hypothetical protein